MEPRFPAGRSQCFESRDLPELEYDLRERAVRVAGDGEPDADSAIDNPSSVLGTGIYNEYQYNA